MYIIYVIYLSISLVSVNKMIDNGGAFFPNSKDKDAPLIDLLSINLSLYIEGPK